MVLKLDIRTKLFCRSDRVKSVDYHPHEPWVLTALYNGKVVIWNWETEAVVKSFAIGDAPARCAKFIPRKNWFIVGTDDNCLRVFNYNTSEKVTTIEAHMDYIRSISIHPTRPFVISCSDDMSIKMWDWEAGWKCIHTFEGHSHYVMCIAFNPKDANTFASASLDGTVKMWTLGSGSCSTFKAHEKGVNCLDFYPGADKPYLVTGADDSLVKVWDYQSKACVATMEGHSSNVNTVAFHPDLPLILSGAEDGTLRFWHATTWRFEHCYNYGLERVWSICAAPKGINQVAIGFDEGMVCLQIGKQEPAISMDSNGKVIWARHNEIVSTSIKQAADSSIADGERLCYPVKELGHCELFAQTLQHSPNGRFVVVCGDGEYIIYTALAWRNKAFGKALDFVWASEGNEYAIRAADGTIRVFRNFEEEHSPIPVASDALFGGKLIGVRCGAGGDNSVLCFYDWDSLQMVRQIDIHALNVIWNASGDLVAIIAKDSCFLLRYNSQQQDSDEAFEVVGEIGDAVYSGNWISRDAFAYATCNRICYWIGGQTFTIAHCDSTLFIIGYFPREGKIYAVDKEVEFFSFTLCHHVIDYQGAVIEGDLEAAEQILPQITSPSHLGKVALFMESAGHLRKAFDITPDLEHKFELALGMRELGLAKQVIEEQVASSGSEADKNGNLFSTSSDQSQVNSLIQPKWRQLGDLALEEFKFALAEEAYWAARDYSSLLLMYGTAGGPRASLIKLSKCAYESGVFNVAFAAAFTAADHEAAFAVLIGSKQYCEAAAYARTWGLGAEALDKALGQWSERLSVEKHSLAGKVVKGGIEGIVKDVSELVLE